MNDLISKSRLKDELLKIPSEMGLIKKAWVMKAVNKQKVQDSSNNCNCQHNSNSGDTERCCRCDSRQTNDEIVKVDSLEIIVRMIDNKPYYEVKYREVGEKDYSVRYSSYDLNIVLGFIAEYFEIVERDRQTNADRIRNMSDEELTELITELNKNCLAGIGKCDCSTYKTCQKCDVEVKKWLQSEAE